MEFAYTNELINETSPYLLQHAHNPVQWHAWNDAALTKAKQLDKPILVSIGYAACHWCHVMEKESFENEEVAAYMNEHFINIKIDREERPDLDHIYMDAVQAIAGNGGWPLNVFLTTAAKPFYGGTYFPPQKAFNRPSWKDILIFISDAWQKKRAEIEQQADNLLEHINSSNRFVSKDQPANEQGNALEFTEEQCRLIAENILKSADTTHGGFGNAPKFPQTFIIQYLLIYAYYFKDKTALHHAGFSLKKMLNGGIYDHLAGGMARYSTDEEWLVPHFEKMLYDNALLVNVLCDAYQLTGEEFYKNAIEKTLGFFIKEMQHTGGGFYAALDADSEGVEGKFYVWEKNEIDLILENHSEIFCEYYGITETGNWEHSNILNVVTSKEELSQRYNITVPQLEQVLFHSEKKLLEQRNKRIKPLTDDKILLSWNALLLSAFCKAAAALSNEEYKKQAVTLFNFLIEKFSKNGDIVFHSYKNNKANHAAFLDDYAYLIQSCILLQEITGNQDYLLKAKKITEYVIENFRDDASGFFFYTHKNQPDVIVKKIEIYDGATPSGNSIMAENLLYLSVVFNEASWWSIANKMLITLLDILTKYPGSFAVWVQLVVKQCMGTNEIAITGKNVQNMIKEVLKIFLPGRVLQSSEAEVDLPLLKNKIYGLDPLIFLCKNYSCSAPVADISRFKEQLKINGK